MEFEQFVATRYNTTADTYWEEYCYASRLFEDYAGYLFQENGRSDNSTYWSYMNQFVNSFDDNFADYYSQWFVNTVPSQFHGSFGGCDSIQEYINDFLWCSPWHDEYVLIDYADAYIGELYRQYELTLLPSSTPEPTPEPTPPATTEPVSSSSPLPTYPTTGEAVISGDAVAMLNVIYEGQQTQTFLLGALLFCYIFFWTENKIKNAVRGFTDANNH